jgi:hypothetical protein
MKKFFPIFILSILLIMGCGGSSPTSSGGGGGGGTTPSISINDRSVTEGQTVSFTVSLSASTTSNVTFSFTTANVTADNSDYTSSSGNGMINAGATSTTLNVSTTNDSDVEPDESFTMTLSNVANANVSDAVGNAIIIDDEISFSGDIRPIILNAGISGCTASNCHGAPASTPTNGNLNMGSASYSSMINASGDNGPIIVPGDANSSNFYLKVTSSPPFGGRMPLNQGALSTQEINEIRDWINQGAGDN